MNAPSHADVVEKFKGLLNGSLSRESVATWAQKWVIADDPPRMDPKLWEALKFLMGVDLIATDRPYLFMAADFEVQLAKLS